MENNLDFLIFYNITNPKNPKYVTKLKLEHLQMDSEQISSLEIFFKTIIMKFNILKSMLS